jgi:hypothetical protein
MFKIKLLILLLTSFFIVSCTNNQTHSFNQKYSLAYIEGGFDGLLLKNYLLSNLKSLNIYDPNSNYEIRANINHVSNIYITNIDNTSDREKISTRLTFQIINTLDNCQLASEQITVSQFYVYASSNKFLSNKTAEKKIKKDNTELLVKKFINKLTTVNNKCDE